MGFWVIINHGFHGLGGFLELTGIAGLVPRQNGKARPVLNFECLVLSCGVASRKLF